MIKIENVVTPSPEQWKAVIRGMRNPHDSWARSDSVYGDTSFVMGPNDHGLMMRLVKGGPVHAKFRRMLPVMADITAPFYWLKEYSTYKVGTVANSCSTMHKIAAKEFTLNDFSCEHLTEDVETINDGITAITETTDWKQTMIDVIYMLNKARDLYLKTKDKKYWWQMIQLLPSSYNQKRTVMLNYEVLAGIYPMRKDHKLDEWHTFCDWIKTLPYSEIITGEEVPSNG